MTMKKTLSANDFMTMGVHRPLVPGDLDPEAAVDKTLNTQHEEVQEEVSSRCNICFGPMPCEKHANVKLLGGVTSLDISATSVLADAHEADLQEVIIVGMRHDGTEYFASNLSDPAPSMYHLQRGIYKLNKMMDAEFDDEDSETNPAA